MREYEEYEVWQLAHALALGVYRHTRAFPRDELYGLRAQLRRAVSSVPSNIAEGSGRSSEAEFARYLEIAAASTNEVEYQLRLATDLGYISSPAADELRAKAQLVRKSLVGFRRHLVE